MLNSIRSTGCFITRSVPALKRTPNLFRLKSSFPIDTPGQSKCTREFSSYHPNSLPSKITKDFFKKPLVASFCKQMALALIENNHTSFLSQCFQKLPIDDLTRKEVALHLLKQDLTPFERYISMFPLYDVQARKEILEPLLQKADPLELTWYLRRASKDSIQDKSLFNEVLSFLVKNNQITMGSCTILSIEDEDILTGVALKELRKNPWEAIDFIATGKIKKTDNLNKLFKAAMKHAPNSALSRSNVFFPNNEQGHFLKEGLLAAAYFFMIGGMEETSAKKQIAFSLPSYMSKRSVCEGEIANNCLLEGLSFDFEKSKENYFLSLWKETELALVLGKICSYRNHRLASFLLGSFLSEVATCSSYKSAYYALTGTKEFKVHKILPALIPAKWIVEAEGKPPLELINFLQNFRKELRNVLNPLLQQYLLTAHGLDMADLSSDRKLFLLSKACDLKDSSTIIQSLRLLHYFCLTKNLSILQILPTEDFSENIKKSFSNTLCFDEGLGQVDSLLKRYEESFGSMRVPFAFEIYKANLLKEEAMQPTLERFTKSVLLETFSEVRYETGDNPHLQRIELYGKGILAKWQSLSFEKSLSISPSQESTLPSIKQFFLDKLFYLHWNKGNQDRLPRLTVFLQTGEKHVLEETDPLSQVQTLCIELIEQSDLSQEELLLKIAKVRNLLQGFEIELENDLKSLSEALKPSKAPASEKIMFCTGWEDLFLSGTEVAGSCQRIDGDPNFNKCLLAYCLDGKNAMIAIKNEKNELVARSIFRLLWDPEQEKPVLFLERFYPYSGKGKQKEAILSLAKECAQKLDLELFFSQDWNDQIPKESSSFKTIISLGSSCPFEYSDGGGGITRGDFRVEALLMP